MVTLVADPDPEGQIGLSTSTPLVGFIKTEETDISGTLAGMCDKILSGQTVKNVVVDSSGQYKKAFMFSSGSTDPDRGAYVVAKALKNTAGEYIVQKVEKFVVLLLDRTNDPKISKRGIVTYRSGGWACSNGTAYAVSQELLD